MEKDKENEIIIQVELLKKDITNFMKILDKLDITNDRIQELVTNISKITNLHEQKLVESEKDSNFIWKDLSDIQRRLEKLEKFRWVLVGAGILVTFLFQFLSTIGAVLTPVKL